MPTCYVRTRLASLTVSRKSSWTRVSSVSSGWKVATRKRPCRRSTGLPSSSARTSTSSPVCSTRGARMKTPRSGVSSPRELEVGLEAGDLTAVRVARDLDVDQAEMLAVEDDQARAGAEDRLLEAADRVLEAVEAHQAHERRRLAAWHDEPVEPLELLRLAHLDRLRAEPPQHGRVLAEVPLESEDADPQGHYQPRVSSSSSGGMPAAARPVIASPRPCETRASTSASR